MSEQNKRKQAALEGKTNTPQLTKEEILSRLFRETEAPVEKIKTDSHLDSINDIRKALRLDVFDIADKYIARDRNEYKVRFGKEYYTHNYRFIGITVTKENEKKLMKNKPSIFAWRTLEVIYNRFPKGTVDLLRRRNVKVNGVYLFKHHELFTPSGLEELEAYIKEAVELMRECAYWHQFLRKLSKVNNRPYQLDFFDKD